MRRLIHQSSGSLIFPAECQQGTLFRTDMDDFALERNVISDAELADLLSDCTDGSCPTSPDHNEDYAAYDLDIPFALPVKTEAIDDVFRQSSGLPLFGADDGTGGPDFVKRMKRDASTTVSSSGSPTAPRGSAAAAVPAVADATAATPGTFFAVAGAAAVGVSTAAANGTGIVAVGTGTASPSSPTVDAAAGIAAATAISDDDGNACGDGDGGSSSSNSGTPQRGVKRGADGEGALQYKYPDLNEPGISAEELKRRRRETRLMKNRESANRSRLRRKKNMDSLEIDNGQLQTQLRASRCQISALRELCTIMQRTLTSHGIQIELPDDLQARLAAAHAGSADASKAAPPAMVPIAPAPVPAAPALISPPSSPMSTDTHFFDGEEMVFRNAPMSQREAARTTLLQQRASARSADAAQSMGATVPKSRGGPVPLQLLVLALALGAAACCCGGAKLLAAGAEEVHPMGFFARVAEAVVANIITLVVTLLAAVVIGRKALAR